MSFLDVMRKLDLEVAKSENSNTVIDYYTVA